jgi:hypothetical protein
MNNNQKSEKNKKLSQQTVERIEQILESSQRPYEKKVALFNVVKNLKVGTIEPDKQKRTNWLLQGHLYNELAKQCMDEYKKTTVKAFSNKEYGKE